MKKFCTLIGLVCIAISIIEKRYELLWWQIGYVGAVQMWKE